jgi:Helix-turn-helix domain of resolvase
MTPAWRALTREGTHCPEAGDVSRQRHQVPTPPKVDDTEHIATANRMKADGHTGKDIAKYLGVSRATLYRYLGRDMCPVPPTRSASSPKATGPPTFRAQPTLVVDADHVKEKGGSIGRALFHVDTRVVDDSERDVPTGQVGESRRPPGRQRRVA